MQEGGSVGAFFGDLINSCISCFLAIVEIIHVEIYSPGSENYVGFQGWNMACHLSDLSSRVSA
jgi:hypothetical protein